MELLVDPVVFALPLEEEAEDAHVRYVEHLSAWSTELRTEQNSFFVSEACLFALGDSNRYPSLDGFRTLWAYYGETDLDCKNAFAACMRLLMNTPILEDRIPELRQAHIDASQVGVRPDLLERLLEPMARAFRETLGLVAYAREIVGGPVAENMMLVTHPIEGGPDASICAAALSNSGLTNLDTGILMLYSPEDLLDLADLGECWQDTTQAMQVTYRNLVKQRALPPDAEWAPYAVAPGFNESILRYHYNHRSDNLAQIFRKCVLLLTGNLPPDKDSHHWLVDKGRQRKVGSWGAWRLHITGSPIAIRLHYWRCGSQYILMQVGPHANLGIDDPPAEYL